MRTLKKDNFQIMSLTFKEMSYADSGTFVDYKLITNYGTVFASNFNENKEPIAIHDIDPFEFNEKIYDLIKFWKRNYEPKEVIFDSLDWRLNITLEDGTKYRFKGYHILPDNFEKLEEYFISLSNIKEHL